MPTLADKYQIPGPKTAFLTGIQALVRLPLIQHHLDAAASLKTAGYISGYRGSPVGTLDQSLWQITETLTRHQIHFHPAINEDLAATAIWGSQQAHLLPNPKQQGIFAMWYGKGPGVDRSMDVLKHANAFGTAPHGGVLAIAGDDHACKSSTTAHQSEQNLIAAQIPILNPAHIQDLLDYGIYGWALSRYSGCWIGIKAITETMDSARNPIITPTRIKIRRPKFAPKLTSEIPPELRPLATDPANPNWWNANPHATPLQQEALLHHIRLPAVREFTRANHLNRITHDAPRAQFGIITSGKSHLDTLEALTLLNLTPTHLTQLGIRIYKIAMPWPLEPTATLAFAQGLREILVIEEKRNIIQDQLTALLYNANLRPTPAPAVVGKTDHNGDPLITPLNELTPRLVARAIGARILHLAAQGGINAGTLKTSREIRSRLHELDTQQTQITRLTQTPTRTPYFCSGCPHNTSTRIPEGSVGMAGIGCHYMVKWMHRNTDLFTHMGGEGASWLGIAPFTQTPHVFQNIGDGTYFHSGILAIRAAIAAKVNITFKLLYNGAVAMTGGQPMDGSLTLPDLTAQLRAEGIPLPHITIVTDAPKTTRAQMRTPAARALAVTPTKIHPRAHLPRIQTRLQKTPGTTIIIYAQDCATEKRRQRKRNLLPQSQTRVFINPEVCEGCGDCSTTSNCLSVLPHPTPLGEKRRIDQNACNQDLTCVDGFCPSLVTITAKAQNQDLLRRPPSLQYIDIKLPSHLRTRNLPTPKFKTNHLSTEPNQPYSILITGIGGTGVLTLGSLIAYAAHAEGKSGATLNQTGLAQKFGAVVSHVRIAQKPEQIHAARIPESAAHLLLGSDLVVAAAPTTLAHTAPTAAAVINTQTNPTPEFIHDPAYHFPKTDLQTRIRNHTTDPHLIPAADITRNLLGDPIATNLFLLGYAYQLGYIPLKAESIHHAIAQNGVSIQTNQHAFTWGRRHAIAPRFITNLSQTTNPARKSATTSAAAAAAPAPAPEPHDLDALITHRHTLLTAYQNRRYADHYRTFVETIRTRETQLPTNKAKKGSKGNKPTKPTKNLPLTTAVARNYYRLMAYKDEYEVARLHTNGDLTARLKTQFDLSRPHKLHLHLAAPLLARRDPTTGHLTKRAFPAALALPLLRLLARLKILRGTPFDPFGYQSDRRQERRLRNQYHADLLRLTTPSRLTPKNHPHLTRLAHLPDLIKGFGHIKAANIQTYQTQKAALLRDLKK